LLRRDAAAAARARLEDKEIRRLEQAAARYKVWAVKNPDLNKRKNAVETRIARIEKDRTQTYVARERRLELADGDIDAPVALRLAGLDVTVPGTGRKLIGIDRLTIAAGDRIAVLGANGAGKSTLLSALAAAFDPEREHYGQAPVRFNPACRLVYSTRRSSTTWSRHRLSLKRTRSASLRLPASPSPGGASRSRC
jgi:ATPase subunit of ABC transporter with duplicated ATPase domains